MAKGWDPLEELTRLRALLRELVDGEPCRYDHDEYCQTHYRSRPCPQEQAKEILSVDYADGAGVLWDPA